ncbi:MAG: hypothetical protein AABX85_03025 [Nanoarchaeota archaeon]
MKKEMRKYSDRPEYIIKSVSDRRRKIRFMALQHAGGKCIRCGYNKCPEVLEFHHKNPSEKKFGIGQNGLTRSWEKVKEEIKKCNLLCANCHREQHVEERQTKEKEIQTQIKIS